MIESFKTISWIKRNLNYNIENIEYIYEGVMNHTYSCQIDFVDYIIKINPRGRENIAIKEALTINLCNKNNCKVPEVIYLHKFTPETTNSFIIYKKLNGNSLSKQRKNISNVDFFYLSKEIQKNFNIISSINLNPAGDTLDFNSYSDNNWKNFLLRECEASFDFMNKNNLIKPVTINKLNKYINNEIKKIKGNYYSLVWADFDPSNIIIDNHNKLAGFVDFESVLSGDPAYAIGCYVAKYGYDEFILDFIKNLDLKFDLINFYSIIRYLRLIKYVKHSLPTGKKRENINFFLPHSYSQLLKIL